MLKTVLNMLVGALITAAISCAFAAVGNPPLLGFQAVDGTWLLGLASGQNQVYSSGITAHAGGTQAACYSLTPQAAQYEVDTVASGGDSICLPFAIPGTDLNVRNAGAQSMNVFGQAGNNLLTSTTDTINGTAGSTAYALTSQNNMECFAAKAGAWSCSRGN